MSKLGLGIVGLADTGFVGVGGGAGLTLRSVSTLRVLSHEQGEAEPADSGQTPSPPPDPQDTPVQFFNLISHQSLIVSAE